MSYIQKDWTLDGYTPPNPKSTVRNPLATRAYSKAHKRRARKARNILMRQRGIVKQPSVSKKPKTIDADEMDRSLIELAGQNERPNSSVGSCYEAYETRGPSQELDDDFQDADSVAPACKQLTEQDKARRDRVTLIDLDRVGNGRWMVKRDEGEWTGILKGQVIEMAKRGNDKIRLTQNAIDLIRNLLDIETGTWNYG